MNRLLFALVAIVLLICTPSLLFATWSLGAPPDYAELFKTSDVGSGGMTTDPSMQYKVYFHVSGDKYDVETDTSPAMGAMWSHTHTATTLAPHDCPVVDDIQFCLEVGGSLRAAHSYIDMNP